MVMDTTDATPVRERLSNLLPRHEETRQRADKLRAELKAVETELVELRKELYRLALQSNLGEEAPLVHDGFTMKLQRSAPIESKPGMMIASSVAEPLLDVVGSADRKWVSVQALGGFNVARPKQFWRDRFSVNPHVEWREVEPPKPGPPQFLIIPPAAAESVGG